MAVVALGFAVAPVAAQNFGARHAQRVRDTFRSAAAMATGAMLAFTVLCQVEGAWMIRLFSSDPQVIAVGDKYLEIVSWSFVGSGIVFVAASMFQAMGNTVPSLIASAVRIGLVAVPLLWMSRMPGFELQWVWYLSVAALTVQVVLQLAFLRREYGRRLDFALVEQG